MTSLVDRVNAVSPAAKADVVTSRTSSSDEVERLQNVVVVVVDFVVVVVVCSKSAFLRLVEDSL